MLRIPKKDAHKATAIGDVIARLTSMRKMDLAQNGSLAAAGWKALLSNLHPTVEEFNLKECRLDHDKVTILIYFDRPHA